MHLFGISSPIFILAFMNHCVEGVFFYSPQIWVYIMSLSENTFTMGVKPIYTYITDAFGASFVIFFYVMLVFMYYSLSFTMWSIFFALNFFF